MAVEPHCRASASITGAAPEKPWPPPPTSGRADQAEQPGLAEGVDRGPGKGAGAVDLVGGGGHDVADDSGQGVQMGR